MSADNKAPQISYLDGMLTNEEKNLGFKMLWDGKTTNGWRGAKLSSFPENGWIINNGIITVQASNGKEARNGGDIITRRKSKYVYSISWVDSPTSNKNRSYKRK